MHLFRHEADTTPLTPPDNETTEHILATIEQLQLDKDEVMVVGSAALVLYGAKLNTYDPVFRRDTPRPGDVDFGSTPGYMEHLYQHGSPSGISGIVKPVGNRQTILQFSTDHLPVDVITRYNSDRHDIAEYDSRFRKLMRRHSRPLAGSSVGIADESYILHELRSHGRVDPKAAADLRAFRIALEKSRNR